MRPPSRGSTLLAATELNELEHEELLAAMKLGRSEDPRWRWLFPVTYQTRDFMREQLIVLQVAYVFAVVLIYLAAKSEEVTTAQTLNLWLGESAANLGLRIVLYVPLFRLSQGTIAKSRVIRLIPIFGMIIVGAHWAWTATLFVGHTLDLTVLVVFLVFVMLSVAAIAVAPGSPATCVLYLLSLWVPLTFQLVHASWVGKVTFSILLLALVAILGATFRVVIGGVRRYLIHSDEVDALVAELRQRNAEVEALRRAAETDFSTRSAFFASASHDVRQRVHAMKLLANLEARSGATREAGPPLPGRLGEAIEDLEFYISNVLDFARLESTSVRAKRRKERLQAIFQQIEIEFEEITSQKRVDLVVRTTQLVLCTDGKMLLRILENLVSNAIKFGGRRVLVTARRRNGDVLVEVRDLGHGIRADWIDSIFEPFQQAPDTAQDARAGVGLGLAIVKRLATALGLRIQVISHPGRGTLMRLIVPAEDVVP